MIVFGGVDVEQ